MKKTILLSLMSIGFVACFFCTGCHRKAFATGPDVNVGDTTFIAFTKSLKDRLDHDGVDITKIQFYIDQKLTLRRVMGSEKGVVKSGVILFDNGQYVNELVIPAYTPGVCEKATGDDLKISFDAPGKTFEFEALYNNNNFILTGTNWHNGLVDVEYDNQTYQVQCACNNTAEARLMVRKNQTIKKDNNARVVAGRKVN